MPLIQSKGPTHSLKKHPHSITLPPPCLMVGNWYHTLFRCFFGLWTYLRIFLPSDENKLYFDSSLQSIFDHCNGVQLRLLVMKSAVICVAGIRWFVIDFLTITIMSSKWVISGRPLRGWSTCLQAFSLRRQIPTVWYGILNLRAISSWLSSPPTAVTTDFFRTVLLACFHNYYFYYLQYGTFRFRTRSKIQ